MVAPTVDPQTRNGIVYVDLRAVAPAARAPACSRAANSTSASARALTVPQSAVLLRDGFSYVLRVGAGLRRSAQTKVTVGRRVGDRIEITGGLDADARVVASGGGFLTDGDTVRVVDGRRRCQAARAATPRRQQVRHAP